MNDGLVGWNVGFTEAFVFWFFQLLFKSSKFKTHPPTHQSSDLSVCVFERERAQKALDFFS